MRNLISTICLLILFVVNGNAQYHQLVDTNSWWRITQGGYQCGCCAEFALELGDDITLLGTTYKSLLWSGYTRYEDAAGNCSGASSLPFQWFTYVGALREDTTSRKVYYLDINMDEHLLYDFNLGPGDTIVGYLDSISAQTPIIVDSVVLNDFNGTMRKEMFLSVSGSGSSSALYETIIEGIGNTGGLLGPITKFEWGQNLLCFKNNDTVYWSHPSSPNCNVFTSITEAHLVSKLQWSFNDSKSEINYQIEISDPGDFVLWNMAGQEIKRVKLLKIR